MTCFGELPTIREGGTEICWMGHREDSDGDMDIYCNTTSLTLCVVDSPAADGSLTKRLALFRNIKVGSFRADLAPASTRRPGDFDHKCGSFL